jgi:hypothetical protein
MRPILLPSVCFCVLALTASGASRLAAQASPFASTSSSDDRVQITIVLTDRADEPMLMRRAGAGPRNVILLNAGAADPQQLSDAVFQLLVLEAQDPRGERRADDAAQRVRTSAPHPVYPWAAEAVERLRTASRQQLRGVEHGRQHRTLQLWVPRLRGASPE